MARCDKAGEIMRIAASHRPNVESAINLNIGCGKKLWPGFVNIDFASNWSGKKPDIECDVRDIPLPDDYADNAYAIHVLEHFYRWETGDVLKEWVRVLKPGGTLVIEVPCMDKVMHLFNYYVKNKRPLNQQATLWRLYGDPDYRDPNMVHKWCFSVEELKGEMAAAGLNDVVYSEPEYHVKECDMRISGVKNGR